MIQVELNRNFVKAYDKRIKLNLKLAAQTQERVDIFKVNSKSPILKDHALIGKKKGLRSFSITGDIRVIYYLKSDNLAIFVDIGSHSQVY